MNFKMVRQARNRNNVSHSVALHSTFFVEHKMRVLYWNMLLVEVGNAVNKRGMEYHVDELRHRSPTVNSSALKVI